ncbi:MAG: hypothetical protein LUE93_15115 [Bacteroides sp.]|nr:hypothetical protein [Bacteroides sp.]
MAIIIKEIHVRTTVISSAGSAEVDPVQLQNLKRELLWEIKLQIQQERRKIRER